MHYTKVRPSLEALQLNLQLVRQPKVVCIAQGDELSGADSQTAIPGASQTTIHFVKDWDDAVVKPLPFFSYLPRAIRRTVICNDQFQVGMRLGQHALNCTRQVTRIVERWHQYAYFQDAVPFPGFQIFWTPKLDELNNVVRFRRFGRIDFRQKSASQQAPIALSQLACDH